MNPRFNFEHVDELTGKKIIIELVVRDYDESLIEKKVMVGTIVGATLDRGIDVRIEPTDEHYYLPPDYDQLQTAAPGEYRLLPTDITVVNPDIFTSHVVHLPPPEYNGPVTPTA